ncbi:hypothetical protein FA15DRAFT_753040 [Coprinopsis marcescibilis]|uniref:Arrestin-like N-terminal domain-containing protein n=1 Tax=Coprinopsis marcescibilis TaxID=230819 RepID=A0A5C3LK13_COPMA|nr:hypothetical protein FA15DRAFT_753040 [Coprinopsis marcescibilis]
MSSQSEPSSSSGASRSGGTTSSDSQSDNQSFRSFFGTSRRALAGVSVYSNVTNLPRYSSIGFNQDSESSFHLGPASPPTTQYNAQLSDAANVSIAPTYTTQATNGQLGPGAERFYGLAPPQYSSVLGVSEDQDHEIGEDRTQHFFHLRSGGKSKGAPWATLHVKGTEPSLGGSKHGRLPRFYTGDDVSGHLALSLSSPQNITSIRLALRGKLITSYLHGGSDPFLDTSITLWDRTYGDPQSPNLQEPHGKKFEGKLQGQYTFPFKFPFPGHVDMVTLLPVSPGFPTQAQRGIPSALNSIQEEQRPSPARSPSPMKSSPNSGSPGITPFIDARLGSPFPVPTAGSLDSKRRSEPVPSTDPPPFSPRVFTKERPRSDGSLEDARPRPGLAAVLPEGNDPSPTMDPPKRKSGIASFLFTRKKTSRSNSGSGPRPSDAQVPRNESEITPFTESPTRTSSASKRRSKSKSKKSERSKPEEVIGALESSIDLGSITPALAMPSSVFPTVSQGLKRKGKNVEDVQPLPPSFLEHHISANTQYELVVYISHGRFRGDSKLKTVIVYIPAFWPPPSSKARRNSYREGAFLRGPLADPRGWRALSPVTITGRLQKERKVEIECTLSLAEPLVYARGTVIPCYLVMTAQDSSALNILATPKAAPRVKLSRLLHYRQGGEPSVTSVDEVSTGMSGNLIPQSSTIAGTVPVIHRKRSMSLSDGTERRPRSGSGSSTNSDQEDGVATAGDTSNILTSDDAFPSSKEVMESPTQKEEVVQVVWWVPPKDVPQEPQRRYLEGEIHLPPDLQPSCGFSGFGIQYVVELLPFASQVFEPTPDGNRSTGGSGEGWNSKKRLVYLKERVVVATMCSPDEPIPNAFTEPDSTRKQRSSGNRW